MALPPIAGAGQFLSGVRNLIPAVMNNDSPLRPEFGTHSGVANAIDATAVFGCFDLFHLHSPSVVSRAKLFGPLEIENSTVCIQRQALSRIYFQRCLDSPVTVAYIIAP